MDRYRTLAIAVDIMQLCDLRRQNNHYEIREEEKSFQIKTEYKVRYIIICLIMIAT